MATFSILSERLSPDPYRILSGVDWSWPHLMLQRRPQGDQVHFFIEAQGQRSWSWDEVKPEDQDVKGCKGYARRANIWARIVQELADEQKE